MKNLIEYYEAVEEEAQEPPEETKSNLMMSEHSIVWRETSLEQYMEKYMRSLALYGSLSNLFDIFYDTNHKEKCEEYALKSANYGCYLAMVYLFESYRKIPPLKIEDSNMWFQNIIALKNPDIFFHIGELYYGRNEDLKLVRNLNFARFFYEEAAKLGLEKAKESLKNLDKGEFL